MYYWVIPFVIAIFIIVYMNSSKIYNSTEHNVNGSTLKANLKEVKNSKLVYANGDSITFYQAWKGDIEPGSVFHPMNPWWYFDISGLDSKGKLIFSTGWHKNLVLSQIIPPFDDIKRWQITLATNISTRPPSDVYQKLKIE